MNSSANWRISTTGWMPGHNGCLDQRSDSDTNGRKLTGVAILFKPGQIFVTHWIFGCSAKEAKQGWQGLEMQLEGAFLGQRARLWVIFGRQARLELSWWVHLVQCCWYHLATRLNVENTFDRQKNTSDLASWPCGILWSRKILLCQCMASALIIRAFIKPSKRRLIKHTDMARYQVI